MKKINVIGGGIGGLAISIRLAARGFDVSLFESHAKTLIVKHFQKVVTNCKKL